MSTAVSMAPIHPGEILAEVLGEIHPRASA